MTDWMKLVAGGFANRSAPFAVHPLDRDRARFYRDAVRTAGLDWRAVERQVSAYADSQGWTDDKRAQEMMRVRKFMGTI